VGTAAFSGVADGAAALVVVSTSFGESGDDWKGLTVDPILTWTTTDGKVTITECNTAASGLLVIPDTIEGNPVTSLGDRAFYNCTSLTSITIPDGVTSIGVAAFRYCTRPTSITIPDSVTSIGIEAFGNCDSVTNITIGNGVTSIGEGAFSFCTSLTAVGFLGDAPRVSNDAFKESSPTIYRAADAKGWGDTLAGRPVKAKH